MSGVTVDLLRAAAQEYSRAVVSIFDYPRGEAREAYRPEWRKRVDEARELRNELRAEFDEQRPDLAKHYVGGVCPPLVR